MPDGFTDFKFVPIEPSKEPMDVKWFLELMAKQLGIPSVYLDVDPTHKGMAEALDRHFFGEKT